MGKDFLRSGYLKRIKKLRFGDTPVINKGDRLDRNYDEILEQWRVITKEKRAAVVVLDMPMLDAKQGRIVWAKGRKNAWSIGIYF